MKYVIRWSGENYGVGRYLRTWPDGGSPAYDGDLGVARKFDTRDDAMSFLLLKTYQAGKGVEGARIWNSGLDVAPVRDVTRMLWKQVAVTQWEEVAE